MPTIARFHGVIVRMYVVDHPPPHCHVIYNEHEANVSIETGEIIEGKLPPNTVRMVRKWVREHQAELVENWKRARAEEPLKAIGGQDAD